ncbi:RNA dependent RNA polymerase-domain-containing protein [Lanmaoa asiatica]|nr:RNA dependent RNA polymerase-domain-containing protein [Lanmaoa asiatica]
MFLQNDLPICSTSRTWNSSPPSPSTLPQPAKRLHANASALCESQQDRKTEFGRDLDSFIIAHDASVQALLDENHLAWGTIYEIARGVTKGNWKWSSVTKEKVQQLRGTNARAAHQVAAVIQGREVPRVLTAEPWIEYDREQDAILENKGRGLGGMGPWKGQDSWYGGRIQQVGRLVRTQGRFLIQLEKPEIRRSHRFSRYLGSRRILQVRVTDDLLYKHGTEVRLLLNSRKFILCGRVFLPFHAKEGGMYLIETSLDFERVASDQDGDQFRKSLGDFINWHNPLPLNKQQPISKWSTRWALGLSTSIPTIEFEPQYIYKLSDIHVSPQDWEGKAPAEKVLTDGCGFINGAALTQIMRLMKYSIRPTAVQGRIGGSKGMWVLHPDPLEQIPDGPAKIWIRPSQRKIELGETSALGPAQKIFDLLAPSRVTGPSRLSSQTLINLSYNGISHPLLKDLMKRGLEEEIQSFIDWNQPQSMIMVWKAVERAGSVVVSRLRRQLTGQARALGLGQLHPIDDQGQEGQEDDGNSDSMQFIDASHKKYSGQPLSLHESVLELLQAGFHPLKLDLLFQKLESVITLVLDDYVEKFHIPVMESCEAYIIPDPYGVLEEGQIHFRSSEPFISPSTGEQTDIILGEVLVSRNPTRLPSDVQKVTAVAHPKLSNYFNVIVFPIKGKQSLASFLGGGDHISLIFSSTDVVMLNWYKPLVEQFRGSPLCTAPSNLSTFFEREVEHVRTFDVRVSQLGNKQAQQAFQTVLLLGLAETRVGLYSKFHDAAVYEFGYGSQKAIHLAYMFTTCLDASKTGLRPWYAWKLEQGKEAKNNFEKPILKREGFILDVLVEEGDNLRKEALLEYRKLKVQSTEKDQDLCMPWHAAKEKAIQAKMHGIPEGIKGQWQSAKVHLLRVHHLKMVTYDKVASSFAKPPSFRGFVFFSDDDVQTLKASLASIKSLTFAFSVAFHDLCSIKARATGNIAITHQFAQCITVPNIVSLFTILDLTISLVFALWNIHAWFLRDATAIFCLGNPLLDVQVRDGEAVLKKYDLVANNAILAEEKHQPIYEEIVKNYPVTYVAGGASQNAARGAAYVLPPGSVVYTGCVGDDDLAEQLRAANRREGLDEVYLVKKGEKTGACAVIITGHHRSLVTTLRAAEKFEASHLSSSTVAPLMEGAKVFYVEGFFLTHGVGVGAHAEQTRLGEQQGTGSSVSSSLIIPFSHIHTKSCPYTDIVIGNESEAQEYAKAILKSDTTDIAEIAKGIATYRKANARPRVVVITQGSESTIVVDGKAPETAKVYAVTPIASESIVDTNGAGDAFAGGFLGAYVAGKSLDECVEVGHKLGAMCVQLVGPQFKWPKVQVL